MKTVYCVLICGLGFIIGSSSCDITKYDGLKMRVNNSSNNSIYVCWSSIYPDTTLYRNPNPKYNAQRLKVEAHAIQKEYYGDVSKGLFAYGIDTIMVCILDAQTVENTPWERVQEEHIVLQNYYLSLQDLERLNWIVTYPPTVEMKGIKMYPRYPAK